MGDRRLLAVVCCALLLTSGCAEVDGLSLLEDQGISLEDLPGMGSVDLEDARVTLTGTGCRETHLMTSANASRVRDELAPDFALAHEEAGHTKLAVTVTECREVTVDNLTVPQATLLEISTPIQRGEQAAQRADALLAVGAENTTLAAHLGAAGLPVEPVASIERDAGRDYGIAEQASIAVDGLGYSFTAHLTSVSVQADVPFGTSASIGRQGWAKAGNDTLTLRKGLEVSEIGGVSATIETSAGDPLAQLAQNTSQPAHGFHAEYDVRMGVVEGAPQTTSLDELG